MSRTYPRDAKHYDRAVLTHLVETGQAQWYPAQGGIYVIKTEDGTVAVRPHQIIDVVEVQADPVVVNAQWEALQNIHAAALAEEAPVAPAPVRRGRGRLTAEQEDVLRAFL